MKKEKKLKPVQKIALERIHRLVELAKKMQEEGKENYVKRYLTLAKKISEKYTTQIPTELKQNYCKKCYSMNIIKIKQKPFLITKCEKCGFEKKYSLEGKKKE
jgi:RNase P subunit RPR2